METKLEKKFQESSFFGAIRYLKIIYRRLVMTAAETSKRECRKGSDVFRYVKVNYSYSSRIQPHLYGPRSRRSTDSKHKPKSSV